LTSSSIGNRNIFKISTRLPPTNELNPFAKSLNRLQGPAVRAGKYIEVQDALLAYLFTSGVDEKAHVCSNPHLQSFDLFWCWCVAAGVVAVDEVVNTNQSFMMMSMLPMLFSLCTYTEWQ
jgi:hypothetical protein